MKPEAAKVERYVRGKNKVYAKWRKGKHWNQLDEWCSECLLRFGELPHFIPFAQAMRAGNYGYAESLRAEQNEWRNKLKAWAFERGIVRYPRESVQFYKYYAAWYRWQWETRHGEITRMYARQFY